MGGGVQNLEETKGYCEVRQEFRIHTFSIRGIGKVAYLKKEFEKVETHFEETVAICGILSTMGTVVAVCRKLEQRASDFASFDGALPGTYGNHSRSSYTTATSSTSIALPPQPEPHRRLPHPQKLDTLNLNPTLMCKPSFHARSISTPTPHTSYALSGNNLLQAMFLPTLALQRARALRFSFVIRRTMDRPDFK